VREQHDHAEGAQVHEGCGFRVDSHPMVGILNSRRAYSQRECHANAPGVGPGSPPLPSAFFPNRVPRLTSGRDAPVSLVCRQGICFVHVGTS
jgi:hypothetical protein